MKELYHYRVAYRSNYDGDTVRFDVDLGFGIIMRDQIFRLFGIDTPELRGDERAKGLESRDWLQRRLEGAEQIYVRTHKDQKGKYGRWLAEILIDGDNVNEEMVTLGLAEPYLF